MQRRLFLIILPIIILLFSSFILYSNYKTDEDLKGINSTDIDKIISFGYTFIGKPYFYKVPGFGHLDCSTFIAYIFSKFGYDLPRDPDEQYAFVKKIKINDVKKGDLLFFRGAKIKSKRIGHVGIVVYAYNDTIKMLHSCSRGILVENYNDLDYYKKRFVSAGRVTNITKSLDTLSLADSTYLSINAVGDIMLGSNYPSIDYLPYNDGKNIFDNTKHILANADITFGNLEGCFLTNDVPPIKDTDLPYNYAFRSPDHYINYLIDAGFNLLNVANNHVGDFGYEGILNTINLLKQNKLHFAGLRSHPYTIYNVKNYKVGFAGFSVTPGTLDIYDTAYAKKVINKLNNSCDIVIVSMHIGAEGEEFRHITNQEEFFLGYKRGNPIAFAKFAIDNGADVVLGHGPHVLRAVELYNNKFIAYSMGNFFTYGKFNINGYCGRGAIINIKIDKNGNFVKGKIYSTYQTKSAKLALDKENKALNDIIELTNSDITNNNLIITNKGELLINNKIELTIK